MAQNPSVKQLIDYAKHYQESGEFNKHLHVIDLLLNKDPNNSEYILWKLQALDRTGNITQDLKLLTHYVNMRSSDITGYLLLYKAFMQEDNYADALIALTYALSVGPDDQECKQLLNNLLHELNPTFKRITINILTTARIGHLSCEVEPWLRRKNYNNVEDCLTIFISNGQPSANTALFSLLKNYADIVESPFWFNFYATRPMLLADKFYEPLPYDVNSGVRGASAIEINAEGIKNLIDIYNKTTQLIEIPKDDVDFAWSVLSKYSISQEDKIVCLHVRDSHYLDNQLPGNNWSYHDYRDADITTYEKSVTWLIEQGYKVIRIGNGSNQSLALESASYLDFCLNRDAEYGDFIELMLLSVCDFLLGTTSGPIGVAAIFDTPTLVVNAAPFEPPYFSYCRFIPKRIFQNNIELSLLDISAGKTLAEDNDKQIMYSLKSEELASYNIEYQNNTDEDILLAVKEFTCQLSGRKFVEQVTQQQKNYWEKLPQSFPLKLSTAYVCDSFLTSYPSIFEYSDLEPVKIAVKTNQPSNDIDEWLANNRKV